MLFTEEEAKVALRDYCVSAGLPFPVAESAFTLEGSDKPLVRISPLSAPRSRERPVHFAGKQLLEALILFCHKRKIPLPARGHKEITTLNKQLTLIVRLR